MKNNFLLLLLFAASLHISAQEKFKEVQFDEKFKNDNQGKTKIEINKVKELIHIMIAITDSGLENDDMIEQKGDYYKDVLKNFKSFKEEKIIIKFDSLLKSNPLNYIFLTGNALSYNFKGNNLTPDANYIFPAQSVSSHTAITVNMITTYKTAIENFSKKTDFTKFYKKHSQYYKTIISDYNKMANLQKQWNWLEKNFNTKINNYTIMCSPLINGLNYTTSYTDNGFKQIMMVLPPLTKSSKMTENQNIIFNTRVMFTEVDHNYVNAPSDTYENQINTAFKDRKKWINADKKGSEYYPTPKRVFDEYMTYAAFYLFCSDQFSNDPSTNAYAYNDINTIMKDRGFPKIKEFNDTLLNLRKNNPNKKIDDLYPELIEWCLNQ